MQAKGMALGLKAWALASLAVATVLVSGCAAGGGLAGMAAGPDPVYSLLGAAEGQAEAAQGRAGRHHGGARGLGGGPLGHLSADLGLDAGQKARLKALMQEVRQGAGPGAQMGARRAELKALLGAPQVDAAALSAWLEAREAEALQRLPGRIALAGKMREVLTEAQRAKLAAKLEAGPAQASGGGAFAGIRKAMRDRMVAMIAPNAAQSGAIQALSAKLDALQAQGAGAGRQAIAAFVRSGQAAPLEAAFRAQVAGRLPRAELVAVATSLDANQRGKLLAAMDRLAARHHGPRGQHRGPRGQHRAPAASPAQPS